MRMLVLGAGALGGYFGGRAMQRGVETAFLVRPRRAEQLRRDGLVVRSPLGDITLPATPVEQAGPGYDLVLLSCKAYDLDTAIEAIRPAVEAGAVVLPVLNGLSHIDRLAQAFGAERVLGGLAKCSAMMTPEGEIRHLNDWRWLTFGELAGGLSPRVQAIAAALDGPGLEARAVPDIRQRMWEKLVHLGTVATATVLMRANVGEIIRAGGGEFLATLLRRNAEIAAAHGHAPSPAFMEEYGRLFADPASAYAASMLRDLEAGGRIEAEHILGFLQRAAREAGVDATLHDLAFLHARAYEQRRDAGRLP